MEKRWEGWKGAAGDTGWETAMNECWDIRGSHFRVICLDLNSLTSSKVLESRTYTIHSWLCQLMEIGKGGTYANYDVVGWMFLINMPDQDVELDLP